MSALKSLREHWPEYAIEAWALGMFMVSAGAAATLLEHPASPLHAALPNVHARLAIAGVAMGLTAIALIYSPWGRRSGAHMNPAVTLTFWRLGKIKHWDAVFYVAAQFIGGTLGVLLVAQLLGTAFTAAPVSYATTKPAPGASTVAFAAEVLISGGMMFTVLSVSSSPRWARFTGLCAGLLVALYITFEAPLSGMSMNPARSFASASPGQQWDHLWIYFLAPPLGMLLAAQLFVARRSRAAVACAKLCHGVDVHCIHCGYEPPPVAAAHSDSIAQENRP